MSLQLFYIYIYIIYIYIYIQRERERERARDFSHRFCVCKDNGHWQSGDQKNQFI